MRQPSIAEIVNTLLTRQPTFTNHDVAAKARRTRQAVHRTIARLVASGELVAEGAGRGVHYRRADAPTFELSWRRAGLEESAAWPELVRKAPALAALPLRALEIFHYAFTEMLNNAIDHSESARVQVRVEIGGPRAAFEVIDQGVGAFDHLRTELGLESRLEALQEVSKGKVTTAPDRHSGEGIFFVSRAGSLFELESGDLRWIVDNERQDTAVGNIPERRGTRVRFELDPKAGRPLDTVFSEFAQDQVFDRTQIRVKLFQIGVRFVSRSEGKRLLRGLERFREVILDFQGVRDAGQGFADEVFRVWATAHPDTRLSAENMLPAVAFMIERARKQRA